MNTIIGNVDVFTVKTVGFSGEEERTVRVWTPENYDKNEALPVLYMNDGQNLFDEAIAYAGEWQLDEAMTARKNSGKKYAIVVGIDNGLDKRWNEYCPPYNRTSKPFVYSGKAWAEVIPDPVGDKYADFIVNTLKPIIDAKYNTLKDRENTFIGGSSMGGLISFYIATKYRDVFCGGIIYSPAFLVYTDGGFDKLLKGADLADYQGKLSFYVGGVEFESQFVEKTEKTVDKLLSLGKAENIEYTFCPEKTHSEAAWREMLPSSLDFLLG